MANTKVLILFRHQFNSLRTADEKRSPEIRLLFAGYQFNSSITQISPHLRELKTVLDVVAFWIPLSLSLFK